MNSKKAYHDALFQSPKVLVVNISIIHVGVLFNYVKSNGIIGKKENDN